MRRVSGWTSLLLVFLLTGGSATGGLRRPLPVSGPYLLQELSTKERLQDFETAWKAIRDNYYDPAFNGVDWNAIHERYLPQIRAAGSDEAFYELLGHMAGELRDAHTRVYSPQRAENFKHHQRIGMGFRWEEIEGKLVVTAVTPDSEAARAGIAPGMLIAMIDGIPLAEKLKEAAIKVQDSSSERATHLLLYARALTGEPGSTVKLEFERSDGSKFEVSLKREIDPLIPHLTPMLLPSGNAYIRFDAFFPPAAREFKEAMRKFHDSPGLIIDLRNNPGGSSDELFAIAGNFFRGRAELAVAKTRTKANVPVHVINDNKVPVYSGPVVVLVSEHSGSSAELFTAGMQETGRAKVVGARTCGCVLGVNHPVDLKGGGLVTISKVLWFTPAGRKLEGEGVVPDKIVTLTLSDVRQKRDLVLEEGERLLKEIWAGKKDRHAQEDMK